MDNVYTLYIAKFTDGRMMVYCKEGPNAPCFKTLNDFALKIIGARAYDGLDAKVIMIKSTQRIIPRDVLETYFDNMEV